ncbi:hypothetical protein H5T53_01520 [Candidatus Bipolaricaulota bacterium]|nr:hypothetical protein [Candidatus Bipolaricaulota bacterium]
MEIVIESEAIGRVPAQLSSDLAPATVQAIVRALPIEAEARRWGNEVYFAIPVRARPEAQVETVEAGDIGYWPPGNALCIFFGPTPTSRHPGEIRPASAVNPVGRVLGDPKVFASVRDGDRIVVRAA